VTAEQLHSEAQAARIPVSLATVYNTLHQFTAAGLLRELVIESGRSYFDTNVSNHHHFFFEENGALVDIPGEDVALASLPAPPEGARISRVDVVVRVTRGK
jgi:Fur family iron response transcriptional regulator